MTLRLPIFYSFTIIISFILLIALPVWELYGASFRAFIITALSATSAFPDPPLPITTTNGESCNPNLFPPGHWTRNPRGTTTTTTVPRALHGTIAVQHAIYHHQHPASCTSQRFLIYRASGNGNGIGSVLHRTTILLQAALDLHRILVLHPQPRGQWLDAPFCLDFHAHTLDSCYFQPITNCSIADAMQQNSWEDFPWLDEGSYTRNEDRVLKYDCEQSSALFLIRRTPVMFHELLKQGNRSVKDYYWWRAQGVAYIVRPNARMLQEIERRRVRVFGNKTIEEEGVVSVHVRRGDKGKESPLAADEAYLERVEGLVRGEGGEEKGWLKRSIFLSTEDANTVRFFRILQQSKNWTVRWTEVPRQEGFQGSMAEFARMVGWDEEFLNSLVNLELALECDAWVGMIASNWNRLVDELRSTVRCKYGRTYVDVFVGTNITNFDW